MQHTTTEERLTMLEFLTRRTEAEIAALPLDRLVFDLDLLFDQVVDRYGKAKEAANELRATERLRRLAEKHEEIALARQLAEDEAYMAEVVPVYEQRRSAYLTQWVRYWRILQERVERQGA
jgi:hypothetical protein